MNAAILARSALRTRSTARLMRSDLYHFENTNGQVWMVYILTLNCAEKIRPIYATIISVQRKQHRL
jgi:hypothetical protein